MSGSGTAAGDVAGTNWKGPFEPGVRTGAQITHSNRQYVRVIAELATEHYEVVEDASARPAPDGVAPIAQFSAWVWDPRQVARERGFPTAYLDVYPGMLMAYPNGVARVLRRRW